MSQQTYEEDMLASLQKRTHQVHTEHEFNAAQVSGLHNISNNFHPDGVRQITA